MPIPPKNREGKCCDAVIRHMERASGSIRTDVLDPEKDGGDKRVDLLVTVGGQAYALEHTKVQPFGNRIGISKQWQLVRNCVRKWFPDPLPSPAFYELYIPLDMHPPGHGKTGARRLESLREWIDNNVAVLHERAPGRPRPPPRIYKMDEIIGRPSGWKCEFTIARSNDGVLPPRKPGSFSVFIESPEDTENLFIEEVRNAFRKKCPKLAQRKEQDDGIRTVLIMEVIEPPFAYDAYICKHLPALLEECPAPPDDIFHVEPHRVFWQVWVAKRGEVYWPDERLPMPRKGYQDVTELIARAYPPKLAEAMRQSLPDPIRAEWRPLFLDEDKLEDLKPA